MTIFNLFSYYLKGIIFWSFFSILTITISLILLPLKLYTTSFRRRLRFISLRAWGILSLYILKYICGSKFKIYGVENIPNNAAILFSNHQSIWESIAITGLFPSQTWVIKRELLRIPIFGWGLSQCDPIVINRSVKQNSIYQILHQGKKHLSNNLCVLIFPEGTRVKSGVNKKYKIGGALLASKTGFPVIPIAHNSGEYWPKNSFKILPGEIKISVGPAINTNNKSPEEINNEAKEWIDNKLNQF